MKAIERQPLRDQIYDEILNLLLKGELPPESRVKDSIMAKEFAVSRTPVREALLRLEREGFLENQLNRGFVVQPLTLREVEEIYPVLWTLETLALKSSGPLPKTRLDRLESLTSQMENKRSSPMERTEKDTRWHETLLESCGNERLLAMIKQLKGVALRYEYAYMHRQDWIRTSVGEHREIARLVSEGDRGGAAKLIETHWKRSRDYMLEQISKGVTK